MAGKIQAVANWLLILKPGEHMQLLPETFGVKNETLQTYVNHLNRTSGRRYKTGNGKKVVDNRRYWRGDNLPLTVRYLGEG